MFFSLALIIAECSPEEPCDTFEIGRKLTIECRLQKSKLSTSLQETAIFSEFDLALIRNKDVVPENLVKLSKTIDSILLTHEFIANATLNEYLIRRDVFRCDLMNPRGNSSAHKLYTYGCMPL